MIMLRFGIRSKKNYLGSRLSESLFSWKDLKGYLNLFALYANGIIFHRSKSLYLIRQENILALLTCFELQF